MGWIKCSKEAFEKCSYKGKCGRFDDAFFMDESVCDEFNQSIKSCIVDAVPVVRCKGCKHAKRYERADGTAGYSCGHPQNIFVYGERLDRVFEPIKEPDDFCSSGERRTNQSADVRNIGQFAGGGKTGGPNDADQH